KEILLTAKNEVESNWKKDKWTHISKKMEEKGTEKYPAEFLQKEWKKLEAARAAQTTVEGNALFEAAAKAVADGGDSEEEGVKEDEQDGA
ncbi:MAG: hypothetical protein Q9225_008129, partial [Loekoesia sp. 1 TL-2023]